MFNIDLDFVSHNIKTLIESDETSRVDRLKAMELIIDDAYLTVLQEQDQEQLIKYLPREEEDKALWSLRQREDLDDIQRDHVNEGLLKRALSRKVLKRWGSPHFCSVSACSRYCSVEGDEDEHGRHRCRYHWDW